MGFDKFTLPITKMHFMHSWLELYDFGVSMHVSREPVRESDREREIARESRQRERE
jgi:hypothetical protein